MLQTGSFILLGIQLSLLLLVVVFIGPVETTDWGKAYENKPVVLFSMQTTTLQILIMINENR